MNFTETPALAIYAQVQRDYLPVLGADVTAIISFSDTSTTSMTLLDNGSGEPKASYRFDATNAVCVRHALEASALVSWSAGVFFSSETGLYFQSSD